MSAFSIVIFMCNWITKKNKLKGKNCPRDGKHEYCGGMYCIRHYRLLYERDHITDTETEKSVKNEKLVPKKRNPDKTENIPDKQEENKPSTELTQLKINPEKEVTAEKIQKNNVHFDEIMQRFKTNRQVTLSKILNEQQEFKDQPYGNYWDYTPPKSKTVGRIFGR